VAAWCSVKAARFSEEGFQPARQLALRKSLSERLKAGDVVIIDDLAGIAQDERILLCRLGPAWHRVVRLAGCGCEFYAGFMEYFAVEVIRVMLNTYQVLRPHKVVFTRGAFDKVGERLSQEK
jgi:ribosomal protein L4